MNMTIKRQRIEDETRSNYKNSERRKMECKKKDDNEEALNITTYFEYALFLEEAYKAGITLCYHTHSLVLFPRK